MNENDNNRREGPPSENQFKIKVHNPDLIFKAIKEAEFNDLGSASLTIPLEKILIASNSDENRHYLNSTISFDFNIKENQKSNYQKTIDSNFLNEIISDIQKDNPEFEINNYDKLFKIKTKNENLFSIKFDDVNVLNNYHLRVKTENTSKSHSFNSQEDFNKTIYDFTNINEILINKIYTALEIPKTNKTLYISPPVRFLDPSSDCKSSGKYEPQSKDKINSFSNFEKPNITFDQIGGQKEAVDEIKGLCYAIKNPELYEKWGTDPPKGILFHGPPGTGKTLLAKALANESGAEFMNINVSDILSKYVGESEKNIASIFKHCQENQDKKFIIFIDEIESIATRRDLVTSEYTASVTATFLTNMDGMLSTKNTTIIGCTNRLEAIDIAFVRSGRLDRLIEVPLPDKDGRNEIFEIMIKKANQVAKKNLFLENVNWDEIVEKTANTSGADIAEIIRRTLEEKVRLEGSGQTVDLVSTENILNQIKKYEKIAKAKKLIGFTS